MIEIIVYIRKDRLHISKSHKKVISKRRGHINEAIVFIILVGSGSILYFINLTINRSWMYYSYYEDDDLTDVTLYAGDYFFDRINELQNQEHKILLFNNLKYINMWFHLTCFNFLQVNYSYTYNDTNQAELVDTININAADYAITPKYEIKASTLTFIKGNYLVLRENSRYIFYIIK